MSEFFGICGICAVCCAVVLLLGVREKELSSIISAFIYIIIIIYAITKAGELFGTFSSAFEFSKEYLPLESVLKVGGIALGGAVTASICDDVGQKGIARIIETLTMIEILQTGLPLCKEIIEKLFSVFGD